METNKMKDTDLKNKNARKDDTHAVATGAGAVGGAVAGAAIGAAVGGPVGTAFGAAIGAVAGGVGGHAVGATIDPAAEDSYWRENHYKQPFAKRGSYDEYQAGYRTGYQGYDRFSSETPSFDDAEPSLEREYSASETDLPWEQARDASRAAWTRAERGEAVRIPITEEQVKVGKREVEQGAATIRKSVRTEQVNVPVDLKREELVVERVQGTDEDLSDDAFKEGEVRIPLMKEEAVVEKDKKVVGAVKVGKREHTEQKNVTETIRKEKVDVDNVSSDKRNRP